MAEEKAKRTRKPRRNFEKINEEVKAFCRAAIAACDLFIEGGDAVTGGEGRNLGFLQGQRSGLNAVLKRLEGGAE